MTSVATRDDDSPKADLKKVRLAASRPSPRSVSRVAITVDIEISRDDGVAFILPRGKAAAVGSQSLDARKSLRSRYTSIHDCENVYDGPRHPVCASCEAACGSASLAPLLARYGNALRWLGDYGW